MTTTRKSRKTVKPEAEIQDQPREESQATAQVAVRPQSRQEHIRLDALEPNPYQPRARLEPEHVREIADSIGRVGLLEKPLARPKPGQDGIYQIVHGHVRIEAIRLLQQEARWPWPTLEMDIRDASDRDMAIIALEENAKRRDLRPIEMYRAYKKAIEEIPGLTITELADQIGLDRSTLSNALRVLQLPDLVLARVDSGELSIHGAREFLCLMNDDHAHVDIMERIIAEIGGTRPGIGPDWRGANIRRLIHDGVCSRLVGEWRHLGPKGSQLGGVHGGYAPDFNTTEFELAFPNSVHRIPQDEPGGKERALDWTCETREWKRWQDKAKAHAQQTMPGVRESRADEEVRKALERDPVARALLKGVVSEETVIENREEAASPKEAFTSEVKEQLGTRGEPVLNLSSTKAWNRPLDKNSHNGLPSYFPDLKECLEKCTWGARYARENPQYGTVRLVCTNQEHYAEKLERGKASFGLQVAKLRDELEKRDRAIIEGLSGAMNPGLAQTVIEGFARTISSFAMVAPRLERDFAFVPPPLAMLINLLGLQAISNSWGIFRSEHLVAALHRPENHEFATIAAALLVYAIGYYNIHDFDGKSEALNSIAQGLGLETTS